MSQDRRHLGPPAYVPGVRKGRLLRLIQEPACHGSLPRRGASYHELGRARGRLALVLYRRNLLQRASALSLMRISKTLETISAGTISIRAVTTSPAKKNPRATAFSGL